VTDENPKTRIVYRYDSEEYQRDQIIRSRRDHFRRLSETRIAARSPPSLSFPGRAGKARQARFTTGLLNSAISGIGQGTLY
jgi:hypothetical protein